MEIGANGYRSLISCEIANVGRYDLIIPVGWWHNEHPLNNIADPSKWVFEQAKCHAHIEAEAVADLFEWDETVAYDEEAQYVEWMEREEEGGVQWETLPQPYWQYKELFDEKEAPMLAAGRTFDHAINLKDGAEPPWGPIYPMSAHQLNVRDKYLKKMMAEGKIADSESTYSAPILFVAKLDGSLPLCVDYRNLNKLTILNKYPLLVMAKLGDHVAGANVFTKLDLNDGYHLIRIRRGDDHKTAFRTRYGPYKYKVIDFGFVNSPATFQTMMNKILRAFVDHGLVVYIDDILIYSENMDDQIKLVLKVLHRLEQPDLAVSLKKSVFHQEEVEFLGYIVKTSGVTMGDRKVKRVQNLAHTGSVKEVQILIGFANFYKPFIKDFSKVCKPITKTLKGTPKDFHRGREQEEAFAGLKKRFTTAAILSHFYPGTRTVVERYASDFVLGCVLSQYQARRLHPVALHSRKLNSAERNYEIHDKELLAIMEAFKEWKRYLWGEEEPVMVYTDHQNLQSFLTKKVCNQRQIRWAQELTNYNFKIVYRPGSRGGKPNALSRQPEYRPEEGARHTEQSILKNEHFQISVIHQKRSGETAFNPEKREPTSL